MSRTIDIVRSPGVRSPGLRSIALALLVELAPHGGRGVADVRDDGRELRFRDAEHPRPILDLVLAAQADARVPLDALLLRIGHDTPAICGLNQQDPARGPAIRQARTRPFDRR